MGLRTSKNELFKNTRIVSNEELEISFGIINDNFRKYYDISTQIIGKGNFGEVRICSILNNQFKNREFVVKIINKKKIKNEKHLINEI